VRRSTPPVNDAERWAQRTAPLLAREMRKRPISPRGPYLMSTVGLLGLYVWAISGDWLGAACLVFVAWLLLSVVAWEARHS